MTMTIARVERQQLCELLEQVGPQAPTLAGSWLARDLAAHLVVRESRPDAAAGIFVPFLRGHTEAVQQKVAAREWADLVAAVRSGPPKWSPFAIRAVDARANLGEFFIHHEDVRRAQPGWEPRVADGERYRALEALLMKLGRFLLRRCPVTVRLDPGTGQPFVARRTSRHGSVTVVGTPDELALWCYGREDHAQVELIGSAADVLAVRSANREL